MVDKHGFETVTDTDHRAWLWVVSLLSLTYSLLCMGARVTCKWEQLSWDDGVLAVAYVVAFVHFGLILDAISLGLGAFATMESAARLTTVAERYFTSRIFGFVTLCLSKVSVLMFVQSVFSAGLNRKSKYLMVAYGLVGVYGVASVLLSSAGCRPQQSLATGASAVCDANIVRWAVLTALDVATELTIIALPAWFISDVHVKASKKRLIVFVFSFRLLVAAASIATMITYFDFLRGSRSEINLVHTVVWQEISVGFSLISASIPCMRVFLWAFASMGLKTSHGSQGMTTGSYGGSQHTRSQPYGVHVSAGNQKPTDEAKAAARSSRFRPDWMDYKVDVRARDRASAQRREADRVSVNSNSSEQMIIYRNTEVEIQYS